MSSLPCLLSFQNSWYSAVSQLLAKSDLPAYSLALSFLKFVFGSWQSLLTICSCPFSVFQSLYLGLRLSIHFLTESRLAIPIRSEVAWHFLALRMPAAHHAYNSTFSADQFALFSSIHSQLSQ